MKRMPVNKKSTGTVKAGTSVDYHIPLSDYHPHHDKHLCKMVEARNMQTVGRLAKGARYICFACGRAAKNKEHLCEPVEL